MGIFDIPCKVSEAGGGIVGIPGKVGSASSRRRLSASLLYRLLNTGPHFHRSSTALVAKVSKSNLFSRYVLKCFASADVNFVGKQLAKRFNDLLQYLWGEAKFVFISRTTNDFFEKDFTRARMCF